MPPAATGGLKTASSVAGPIIDRLTVLHRAAVERRKELDFAAAGVPQTRQCKFGNAHPLNLDESSRESHGQPAFVWVYDPCPECVRDKNAPWIVRAGAPSRLAGATFDNWEPSIASDYAALNLCREYSEAAARDWKGRGFLILSGPVGTGKSHLAVAVMKTIGRGRWITQNAILMKLRQSYRDDSTENIVESCKRAKHLTVDDLGTTTGARDEWPAIYEILSHRYNECLSTVLTMNQPMTKFGEVFGDRLEDRLLESVIVELHGDSHRRTA